MYWSRLGEGAIFILFRIKCCQNTIRKTMKTMDWGSKVTLQEEEESHDCCRQGSTANRDMGRGCGCLDIRLAGNRIHRTATASSTCASSHSRIASFNRRVLSLFRCASLKTTRHDGIVTFARRINGQVRELGREGFKGRALDADSSASIHDRVGDQVGAVERKVKFVCSTLTGFNVIASFTIHRGKETITIRITNANRVAGILKVQTFLQILSLNTIPEWTVTAWIWSNPNKNAEKQWFMRTDCKTRSCCYTDLNTNLHVESVGNGELTIWLRGHDALGFLVVAGGLEVDARVTFALTKVLTVLVARTLERCSVGFANRIKVIKVFAMGRV